MKTSVSSTLVHPSNFIYEIGMRRFSIDILVQLLRIVCNRGHGYDHSFDRKSVV